MCVKYPFRQHLVDGLVGLRTVADPVLGDRAAEPEPTPHSPKVPAAPRVIASRRVVSFVLCARLSPWHGAQLAVLPSLGGGRGRLPMAHSRASCSMKTDSPTMKRDSRPFVRLPS